jgi:hypothetical protein
MFMPPTRLNTCLLLAGVGLAVGCTDLPPRGVDAAAPREKVAQVLVRVEAPSGGAPAISVLAFRATVTGSSTDVLGVIDPLVAPAPGRCDLYDVAASTRALRAQGGTVDLEELSNVSLAVGADGAALRPTPRTYPQLAAAVGGVIGEAGPLDLPALPESIDVALPGEQTPVALAIEGVPRLLDQNGEALAAKTRLDRTRDLQLTIAGPARSFLEIRPFGASRYLACPAGPGGQVTVPRELLEKLTTSGGHGAVSFEAVWRDGRTLTGTVPTRLSIETRSSAVLDLRAEAVEPAKPSTPTVP